MLAAMATNVPKTGAPFKPAGDRSSASSPRSTARSLQTSAPSRSISMRCRHMPSRSARPTPVRPRQTMSQPMYDAVVARARRARRSRRRAVEDDRLLRQPFDARARRATANVERAGALGRPVGAIPLGRAGRREQHVRRRADVDGELAARRRPRCRRADARRCSGTRRAPSGYSGFCTTSGPSCERRARRVRAPSRSKREVETRAPDRGALGKCAGGRQASRECPAAATAATSRSA